MEIKILIIAVLALVYEKIYRVKIIEKKIHNRIKKKGGYVTRIERITNREEIFVITYKLDDEIMTKTVKFSFFYNEYWYD